jgi:hypothetical protein
MLSAVSDPKSPSPQYASAVREAATAFVRGTTFGWGRQDLARWLVCQYSPCLVADATVVPGSRRDAALATLSAASSQFDDERIERIILDARSGILRMLSDLGWPTLARQIAKRAVAMGDVRKVRMPDGAAIWAPVGRARMRLADRVASLFLADAMNRPAAYRQVLLCRHCGELGFTTPIVHDASCERAERRVA